MHNFCTCLTKIQYNVFLHFLGRPTKTEPQRNILVIGTKDSGKSTLIDCLANYTLGVEWEDNFTLRITDPEENDNPHRLKWINVYTIPSTTNTVLPFAVNVVDVSGFSKVRPSRLDDKDVVDNLKKFMQNPVAHEVDNFSSVWFVHSAKDTTVSPMYQHIYNELVQMYGNDIHTKIKTFVTHTSKNDKVFVKKSVAGPGLLDGSEMSVRNMIAFNRMSETPYSNAAEVGANLKGSWSDNLAIMANLSEEVANEKPMSIFITPKNLERREKVTEGFRQLNNLLRIGCQRLQVMYQEKHAIEEKVSPEEIIAQVPDFEYKIQEPVKVIEKSPYCGEEVTNCSVCFVTCHSKCSIRKDEDKRRCWAMTDGYCRICPGKCYWDQHFNRAFQLFVRMEQKTKKFSDLPGEYKVDGNEKTSVLLKALAESSDEAKMYVEGTLEKATRNLQVIDEMSGRKVSTQSECIDVIIHEEMRDGMPDWENRVKILKMLKNEGRLGIRIKGKEHTEKLL